MESQVRELSNAVGARRIQRKQAKGWTRGDAVCVDRSSRFGNPFAVYQDLDGWRIHVLYVADGRFPEMPAFDTKHEATVAAVELFAAWLEPLHGASNPAAHRRGRERGLASRGFPLR
jgi:hypothetical protein